jgi:hypothetical protein
MYYGLLFVTESFAYVEIIFSSKKEVKICCYPCSHALLELNFAVAPHHVGGVGPRLQYPF